MKKIMELFKREEGVTAPEYGLIAALVALAIIVAVGLLGDNLAAAFDRIAVEIGLAVA